MLKDYTTKEQRLHKGDIFQHYNGEPTLLGMITVAILLILFITFGIITL
jgi:hypothetical protein